jgi:hypothetical protein
MAKYEIYNSCTLNKMKLNHQNALKCRTPEFEPILGSENSFSIETKDFRFLTAVG